MLGCVVWRRFGGVRSSTGTGAGRPCARKLYNEALFMPSVPRQVRHTRYSPTATGNSSHAAGNECRRAVAFQGELVVANGNAASRTRSRTGPGWPAAGRRRDRIIGLVACIDRLVVRNGRCWLAACARRPCGPTNPQECPGPWDNEKVLQ